MEMYQKSLDRIRKTIGLENLPDNIKELLKNTTDLETKAKILNAVARSI